MKRLYMSFKKNQIVVFVIGLMLITAGYLSYSSDNDYLSEEMASIGDAKLVSADIVEENIVSEEANITVENEILEEETEEIEETTDNVIEEIVEDDYFTASRLERNTIYSQSIETYQKILENSNVSETQKKTAQQEITKLNNEQNGIMIAENLIKTKGIEDLVIFANNGSINVIVKGEEPSKTQIAQIQNIITRELEADIADIHIMNKDS